ncbi:hypothetical protein HNR74_000492 [Flammeovirga kamogawensis]|nr:hypothetical protein [Flammeovirga kamogawensis]MBB6459342.1 hypothetical protein [Flammeovirga kamogawensis]
MEAYPKQEISRVTVSDDILIINFPFSSVEVPSPLLNKVRCAKPTGRNDELSITFPAHCISCALPINTLHVSSNDNNVVLKNWFKLKSSELITSII